MKTCKACPECGCKEVKFMDSIGKGYRVCANCYQEWWIDIDYTDYFNKERRINENV